MRKTLNLSRRLSSMLLTISTTHIPATDLGYILHKNPARLQTEALSFGKAHVFYPEANVDLCTNVSSEYWPWKANQLIPRL
jgi:hypothetical protein